MPLTRLWSKYSQQLRPVTRATDRKLTGRFHRPFPLKIQMHEYLLQHALATELYRHIPYSASGIAAALRWLNQPPRSGPIALIGGSASSSKLVRDDPYPPRLFIRSRKVDEDPDPDADEYDPELALDFDETSERRGCGSGGTSGSSA